MGTPIAVATPTNTRGEVAGPTRPLPHERVGGRIRVAVPPKISVQVAVPVGMTAHVHLPVEIDAVIDVRHGSAVLSTQRTTLHHRYYQRLSLHSGNHDLLVHRKLPDEVVV